MFTKRKQKKLDQKKTKPSLKMVFFQPSTGKLLIAAIQATDLKYGSTSVVQQLILSQKVMYTIQLQRLDENLKLIAISKFL